jgi:hypothetical protein
MSDRAVFFDPSRRRWWWIKRIGTLFGLFAVVTVSVWLISLFTVPFLDIEGIAAFRTQLRHSIHLPHHQHRLENFIAKSDRQRLLASL